MKFDLDTQRTYVCLAGMFFLVLAMVASYTGHPLSDVIHGIIGSMIVGPVLEGTAQRYIQLRREQKGEDRRR